MFWINSDLILKSNLTTSLSTIKKTWKLKENLDEVTDFYNTEILKVDSNHTCLAVIILDFVLRKIQKLLSTIVFKRMRMHQERKKRDILLMTF